MPFEKDGSYEKVETQLGSQRNSIDKKFQFAMKQPSRKSVIATLKATPEDGKLRFPPKSDYKVKLKVPIINANKAPNSYADVTEESPHDQTIENEDVVDVSKDSNK